MAANHRPLVPGSVYASTAKTIATNTARTNVSGTGTNTALTAATTTGLRIDMIIVELAATSAAALVFLWLYDGTDQILIDEIPIPAITVSNTVAGARVVRTYTNLVLPPTYRLFVSTTIAQNTNVAVFGGDYTE